MPENTCDCTAGYRHPDRRSYGPGLFAAPAAALLDALEHRPGSAFVAWHTLSNFYYLVAPARGRKPARDFLLDLTRFTNVAPTTTESLRYAARLPVPDFEDALQVAAARQPAKRI